MSYAAKIDAVRKLTSILRGLFNHDLSNELGLSDTRLKSPDVAARAGSSRALDVLWNVMLNFYYG
ncbi:MAG: hypothetical protein GY807_14695 [Gammaproteobacteria bacterium]|nr:hypothetical protein [Gammaproteobacteria bacterium]